MKSFTVLYLLHTLIFGALAIVCFTI